MIYSAVSDCLHAGQQLLRLDWLVDHPWWTLVAIVVPIAVAFLMPITLLIQMYLMAWFLKLYRWYHWKEDPSSPKFWDPAKYYIAQAWDYFGRLYYGYEVYGLENIPKDKPALIIFYHGALPVDWYLLAARVYLTRQRLMGAVGDKLLFTVPGWRDLFKVFNVQTGSVASCSSFLKRNELLAISPGGLREGQYGDETYPVLWGSRCGYARVAIEAKVPIIPIFTRNIREAYCTLSFGKGWFQHIYETRRIPVVPIYGGFPVKLKTYVGKPIPYDPKMTPEELGAKVKARMQEMIRCYQPLPGSVLRATAERWPHPKCSL